MELMEHQLEVIKFLSSGKILFGGVGSGKSAAVLGYYMEKEAPRDIYIITTAKKRDSLDWEGEAARYGIGSQEDGTVAGYLNVDSWNKISMYEEIKDAFFIFDEQRVVGHGAWVKSFIKIAKKNNWVLLSATPGDTWLDYAPIFVANGFYKNLTEFKREHVLYEPFMKYPKVKGYLNERRLEVLRNDMLVEMPYKSPNEVYVNYIDVKHDADRFRTIYKNRWNVYDGRPIKDVAEMFRLMRRVVNSDPSRLETIRWLLKMHLRLVIFYNFDYELEILRTLEDEIPTFEWNGHIKDPVPDSDRWAYLVQYMAGAEAWNCTSTNAMVMYSMTYSYKNFVQAMGRIDRLDTKYTSLYYYVFVSNSIIDRAIKNALVSKKSFNEKKFMKNLTNSEAKYSDKLDWSKNSVGNFIEVCQI